MMMSQFSQLRKIIIRYTGLLGILLLLIPLKNYNFLLFHSIVEMLSIIIMVSIFILTWNQFEEIDSPLLQLFGIAGLFIAIIDFIHTLSYKGMNLFEEYTANLPTQLWIFARFLQALSILFGITLSNTKLNRNQLFLGFSVITSITLTLIFLDVFPVCYIEEEGLTPFKIVMEYIIMIMVLIAIVLFKPSRSQVNQTFYIKIQIANVMMILSELFFTFYVGVYDLSNVIGHLFKIITFYLYFRAILVTGLKQPADLLYHNLKQREQDLIKALEEISNLEKLLPVCAYCKKIRDESDNEWKNMDEYLTKKEKFQISHGICPECAQKLYPDYL